MKRLLINVAVTVATGATVALGGITPAQAGPEVVAEQSDAGSNGDGGPGQGCWDWQLTNPPPPRS